MFIEKVINTEDYVNPLLPKVIFFYLWFSKFSGGIKREDWAVMIISENKTFHAKSAQTKIFSTGFASTVG